MCPPLSVRYSVTTPAPHTVFNLLSGVDVAETELTIERYQRANQEQILRNQARQVGALCTYDGVERVSPTHHIQHTHAG